MHIPSSFNLLYIKIVLDKIKVISLLLTLHRNKSGWKQGPHPLWNDNSFSKSNYCLRPTELVDCCRSSKPQAFREQLYFLSHRRKFWRPNFLWRFKEERIHIFKILGDKCFFFFSSFRASENSNLTMDRALVVFSLRKVFFITKYQHRRFFSHKHVTVYIMWMSGRWHIDLIYLDLMTNIWHRSNVAAYIRCMFLYRRSLQTIPCFSKCILSKNDAIA